jgi:hypothetical protein
VKWLLRRRLVLDPGDVFCFVEDIVMATVMDQYAQHGNMHTSTYGLYKSLIMGAFGMGRL